jgi:hypothetical protein
MPLVLVFNVAQTSLTIAGITFTGSSDMKTLTSVNEVNVIPNSFLSNNANIVSVASTGVTTLSGRAFRNCIKLVSVYLPNLEGTIPGDSFFGCILLNSLNIGKKITTIGDSAFNSCSSLTSFIIPDSVTTIREYAFAYCGNLASIVVPDSVTSLGSWVFRNCIKLTNVQLSKNITILRDGLFILCDSLTSITIPQSVTTFQQFVFSDCVKLTNVILENQKTFVIFDTRDPLKRDYTFWGCSLPIDFIYYNASSFSDLTDASKKLRDTAPGSSTHTYISKAYTQISVKPKIAAFLNSGPINLNIQSNNTQGAFTYESSNPSVVSIVNGNLYANNIGSATITITQAESENFSSATATTTISVPYGPISNICFLGNTPIKADQGTFAISNLKEGIHSINGKVIKRITQTRTNDKHLICIEKHTLDMNVPSQKTIITANHKIMYKGKMVKSKDLIGLVDNVYKTKYHGETLYNVLLETHETMNVNNMICETLSPENTIVQLYDILDKIPSEYHGDIIVQFNNQINDKKMLKNY